MTGARYFLDILQNSEKILNVKFPSENKIFIDIH